MRKLISPTLAGRCRLLWPYRLIEFHCAWSVKHVELNVQITGSQVKALQGWCDSDWTRTEDVSPEILWVIERHTRDYQPFEVYVKALQEFFRNHEITGPEWEQTESKMLFVLDQYQKEG